MKRLAFAALSLVLFSIGCANNAEPTKERTDDTETVSLRASVVLADEANGKLTIAVTRATQKIVFDLRLGPKMETPPSPEELAANPELTTHQIDAVVMDADGRPFHMQMGGDKFIEPTWRMPKIENIDEEQRARDYALAREARSVLATLTVPGALEELRRGALEISRGLDTIAEKPMQTAQTAPAVPVEGEGPGVAPKATTVYNAYARYWDYYVAKKDIQFTWGLANHSAVTARAWSGSYSILASFASCNHGTCSTSMSRHCTMSGFRNDDGTHRRYFYSEPSTSTGTVSGGCSTGYAWNSACGHHNCNDDSQVQGESVYYDRSYDTWHGHCSACGSRYSAPNPPGC